MECDNCINRNIPHENIPCLHRNDRKVTISIKDFHNYQIALKERDLLVEKINSQLSTKSEETHDLFINGFCIALLNGLSKV